MYRIRTFNKISPVGLNRLDPALYAVSDSETDEDAILVRSAKLMDYDFPKNLLAISRAGAGVNNIPLDRCSEAGIVVFNTPGANANAVKELVLCAMLMGSRDVDGGIQWVRQQVASGVDVTTVVEKGKAAFIGPELYKKTLGVIGLGAIGSLVANIALSLGMDVYGYDPFLSVDAALRLDRHIHVVKDINELYKRADYITIHIHYTKDTERMIDAKAIGAMKRGVRFINLARGEIVDDDAMLAALDTGWVAAYVTDFPNNRLVGAPHVLAMPHLGASTPESEQNCAVMAVDQLRDYLENGNIRNSALQCRVAAADVRKAVFPEPLFHIKCKPQTVRTAARLFQLAKPPVCPADQTCPRSCAMAQLQAVALSHDFFIDLLHTSLPLFHRDRTSSLKHSMGQGQKKEPFPTVPRMAVIL